MTYRLLSLGCQMNTSDAERIASVLEGAGFAEASSEAQADLLGVVACSVRQKAIDRVYGRIHEWNRWKAQRPLLTFVSGCILPEDEAKFLRLFDLVFRIDDLPQLPEMIRTSGVVTPAAVDAALQPGRSVTLGHADRFWGITPRYGSRHAAFVPIQNGCDKFCTFCAVPYTRGREVSRPARDVLREVEELLGRGYRNITLLGQNVNSYGRDRPGAEPTFAALLDEVGALCDAAAHKVWVYFTSPHPADMSPAVLERIAEHDSLAKQIHLPMQSADDKVLIRMNRNHRLDQYRAVVRNIRATLPTATLFTDIIVGFCGETDAQFERTRRAMEEFAFDMAYIAMYSPRPGGGGGALAGRRAVAREEASPAGAVRGAAGDRAAPQPALGRPHGRGAGGSRGPQARPAGRAYRGKSTGPLPGRLGPDRQPPHHRCDARTAAVAGRGTRGSGGARCFLKASLIAQCVGLARRSVHPGQWQSRVLFAGVAPVHGASAGVERRGSRGRSAARRSGLRVLARPARAGPPVAHLSE